VLAEACARQRFGLLRIESQRSRGVGSIAEERDVDLAQLGSVAVHSPDDERRDAGRPCLEHRQVADAGLVQSARVVHDEHIARPRRTERLEEDIDAAVMADG
jgi:hypothetical protein